jgi:acyl carrier protein phosphodiesterase
MNFLAHIYLSGNDNNLKIGNFIADSIRGNKYLNYPKEIQKGIVLHRHIDTFTDKHPIVKLSKKRLHENYGHYSGVIVDIFYDHFLAKNWSDYSKIPLPIYIAQFYELLDNEFHLLPLPVKKMYPYMVQDNWLQSYASIEGITKVLEGMNRRTKNKSKMNLAVNELQHYYLEFEYEFAEFFKELKQFVQQELEKTHLEL